MKNLKLIFSLAAVVFGLTSLSGCFPDVEEEALCENTCQYAFDGECDDGGPNSQYSLCDCGTDCADCDERAALECDGGSSSSSSGSSSSSSSGGGYSQSDAVGTWFGNSPNSNDWYLYLCGNGLFTFKEYNPVGDLQFNHTGTWSISGSNLYLSGSNSWTFQIIDITTAGAGGMTITSSGSQVILENQLGQDPCSTTGSTGPTGPVLGTVSDNDGNTYQTVVIGTQNWMAENLKTTRTRAGSQIPIGFEHYTSPMYQSQHEVLAVVWKDNDPSKKDVFGGLYNWYTAKRICPDGWHLPSKQEWETLNNYLGVGAAGKLKKTGGLWSFNQDATNESGFSAVPNDMAYMSSGALLFHGDGHDAFWWSSYVDVTYDAMGFSGYTTEGLTTYNTPVYHATVFRIRDSSIFIGQETKGIGTTCRCVED